MRIAVDYDGTITRDRRLFAAFIKAAREAGHEVICVTMRALRPPTPVVDCEVIYTDGARKGPFMEKLGRHVDVWIDDHPEFIF